MLGLAAACATDEIVYQTVSPIGASAAEVLAVHERGGLREVEVRIAGKELRFYLPGPDAGDAGAACTALFAADGPTRYVNEGVLGRFERAGIGCEPVGIGSLAAWRDRRPRQPGEVLPRARATWRVVGGDDQVVFARGRFGIAGQIGWAGGVDTVAVLPRTPACERVAGSGVGTLEYRPAGSAPLVLLAGGERCPLAGLVRPQSEDGL